MSECVEIQHISVRFWVEMNRLVLEENIIFYHALSYVVIILKLIDFNILRTREMCAVFVQKRFLCDFLPPPPFDIMFCTCRYVSLSVMVS